MLIDLAIMICLAILSVGLWTVRVALTAKGLRFAAAGAAAIEAVVFVVAFARVSEQLDSPARLVAYAVGVGIGTLLGLAVQGRLTPQPAPTETPERLVIRRTSHCARPRADRGRQVLHSGGTLPPRRRAAHVPMI